MLSAGAPWLQLRVKSIGAREHLALAREIVQGAASSGGRVIVNDRLDVALASEAAGVHLGQDDLPLPEARRIAGKALVIGISTHDVEQARRAEAEGADYIGFGPMFPTRSKAGALPPRALSTLREVRAAVRLPIVAIGGIEEHTAAEVIAAGADGVAMIRALAEDPSPEELARRLLALP